MENFLFLSLYFIFALLTILVVLIGRQRIQYIFKPLLIPLLIMYYIFNVPLLEVNWFIVAGLTCGLVGNVFFMHLEEDEMFYHGVLAHILGYGFYIFAFFGYFVEFPGFHLWKLLLFLPGLLIVVFILYQIRGDYEIVKLAMIGYILGVFIMYIFSIFFLPTSQGGDFWLLWLGTILLLLSSIIIAINKFRKDIPHTEALFLGIYYLAQFFIIEAIIITTLMA
ncbi:MAG: membrane protein of unknown function [Promethearchaeota archaeon]|nr:MAG: membrane protein of unknown function [Candidatus Lokiarchaeota archaeon]